jgi:hypothetical protein
VTVRMYCGQRGVVFLEREQGRRAENLLTGEGQHVSPNGDFEEAIEEVVQAIEVDRH